MYCPSLNVWLWTVKAMLAIHFQANDNPNKTLTSWINIFPTRLNIGTRFLLVSSRMSYGTFLVWRQCLNPVAFYVIDTAISNPVWIHCKWIVKNEVNLHYLTSSRAKEICSNSNLKLERKIASVTRPAVTTLLVMSLLWHHIHEEFKTACFSSWGSFYGLNVLKP